MTGIATKVLPSRQRFSSLRALAFLMTAALVALSASSHARSITTDEKAALETLITRFNKAIGDGDHSQVVDLSMSPRMLSYIAEKAKLPVDKFREQIIGLTKKVMASVKLESYGMDMIKADYRTLADGTPYLLIPTETVMTVDQTRAVGKSNTLALLDSGRWYLIRISDKAQIDLLREVYPQFQGAEFPQARWSW